MTNAFYEKPILNSPYAKPTAFHPLDEHGQPLDLAPIPGRRPSKFLVPVPKAKRKGGATQGMLDLETYDDNAIINEIRSHVDTWRECQAAPIGASHRQRNVFLSTGGTIPLPTNARSSARSRP